jgi:predicted metal-dependent peptidase
MRADKKERKQKIAARRAKNTKTRVLNPDEIWETASNAISMARGYIYRKTTMENYLDADFLYIDSILSRLEYVPAADRDFIAGTDGVRFYYNPERVAKLKTGLEDEGHNSIATIAGILAHEAIHILFGHTSKGSRSRTMAAGDGSPGENLLLVLRNVAMDKEVNRHVAALFPDMHTGASPASGWNGMVMPEDSGVMLSFEDIYYLAISDTIVKLQKKLGRASAPEWSSIPSGEACVIEMCNELHGTRREQAEKLLEEEEHVSHAGKNDMAHHAREKDIQKTVEDAMERVNGERSRHPAAPRSLSESGPVSRKVKLYGTPVSGGIVRGTWNDMAKRLMESVAGDRSVDDWSGRDPVVEIYESMGFGNMIVPVQKPLFTGHVMLVLDVSHSVSDETFFGSWLEMASFAGGLPPMTQVSFVQTDTAVRDLKTAVVGDQSFQDIRENIEKGEYIRATVSGQTNFHPFLKYVRAVREQPDCIVFFSDLDLNWEEYSPDEAPLCPVLWVTDRKRGKSDSLPPFGDIYELGEEGKALAEKQLARLENERFHHKDEKRGDTVLTGVPADSIIMDLPML